MVSSAGWACTAVERMFCMTWNSRTLCFEAHAEIRLVWFLWHAFWLALKCEWLPARNKCNLESLLYCVQCYLMYFYAVCEQTKQTLLSDTLYKTNNKVNKTLKQLCKSVLLHTQALDLYSVSHIKYFKIGLGNKNSLYFLKNYLLLYISPCYISSGNAPSSLCP